MNNKQMLTSKYSCAMKRVVIAVLVTTVLWCVGVKISHPSSTDSNKLKNNLETASQTPPAIDNHPGLQVTADANFGFFGCYTSRPGTNCGTIMDTGAANWLLAGNSVEKCDSWCRRHFSYSFIALRKDACLCSKSLSSTRKAPSCTLPCKGNPGQTCGGGTFGGACTFSVYKRGLVSTTTTTTTTTTTSAPHLNIPGAITLGCLNNRNRIFAGGYNFVDQTLTRAMCKARCQSRKFAYFGLENGEQCWCANSLTSRFPATNCNVKCKGDASATCGGFYAVEAYALKSLVPPVCSSGVERGLVLHYDFSLPYPLVDKVQFMRLDLKVGARHVGNKLEIRSGHALSKFNLRYPNGAGLTDKTLSAWARLTSLTPRKGSVISIDQEYLPTGYVHKNFDAIVFAEYGAGNVWQPGSEFGKRWAKGSDLKGPRETTPNKLRMLTMVNDAVNQKMIFYVDGVEVMNYKTSVFPMYGANARLVVGFRCCPRTESLNVDLFNLKLYDRVLSTSEVGSLFAKKPTE